MSAHPHLHALAESMMKMAMAFLRDGEDVAPVIVTLDDQHKVKFHVVDNAGDSHERQALKERLVKENHAIAVLMFSDAFTRDPQTMERNGEALMAVIETPTAVSSMLTPYTRNPLEFKEAVYSDQVITAGNTFRAQVN